MAWPQILEFRNAIRNTKNLQHSQLAQGSIEKDKHGQPMAWSGGIAVVYKIEVGMHHWAIRTFQGETDHVKTYAKLSAYFRWIEQNQTLRGYFARVEYLQRGIFLPMYPNDPRNPYPIVLMRWVEGQMLDKWVKNNLDRPKAVEEMAAKWRSMVNQLYSAGIAHNDIQQGNVLVTPSGDLKLIDYDGMFVPSMCGERARELGHPNWRHPRRKADHFDSYLDQFPGYVGYISLLALSQDKSLFNKYNNGQNLIFTSTDLCRPGSSPLLNELCSLTRPVDGVKPVSGMVEDLVEWVDKPVNWKTTEQLLEGRRTPPSTTCSLCRATPASHFVNNQRLCSTCYQKHTSQPTCSKCGATPAYNLDSNNLPLCFRCYRDITNPQPICSNCGAKPANHFANNQRLCFKCYNDYTKPQPACSKCKATPAGHIIDNQHYCSKCHQKIIRGSERKLRWTKFLIGCMGACLALFGLLLFFLLWTGTNGSLIGLIGGLIVGFGHILIGHYFSKFKKWSYTPALTLFAAWTVPLLFIPFFWPFLPALLWGSLNKEARKMFSASPPKP